MKLILILIINVVPIILKFTYHTPIHRRLTSEEMPVAVQRARRRHGRDNDDELFIPRFTCTMIFSEG